VLARTLQDGDEDEASTRIRNATRALLGRSYEAGGAPALAGIGADGGPGVRGRGDTSRIAALCDLVSLISPAGNPRRPLAQRLGTVSPKTTYGCAASCDIAQISIFPRGSAPPGSLGAGFAFAGCSVVLSMLKVPNPSAQ
jgi:hypothetical protein